MTTTATKVTATALALAVAATALTLFAGTASAERGDYRGGNSGDSIKVENNSSASVYNEVEVEAETGENTSTGGDAGNGGRGGNARGDNATGGDGGHGANGGNGGYIETGNASAFGTLLNDINYNLTEIEACDCDDDSHHNWFNRFFKRGGNDNGGSSIRVENDSEADVENYMEVEAETGDNESAGGYGGDGGRGGNATAEQDRRERSQKTFSLWFKKMWGDDDDWTTGGNGGHGANGGNGGSTVTGDAYAEGHVTNYVNHNITRVTRAADEEAGE